ncbi:MAG: DUF302 domain-containing protein [Geminicoccaceae bacterium]
MLLPLGRRAAISLTAVAGLIHPGRASAEGEAAGYLVVSTPHALPALEERLKAAIERAKMGLVTRASASEGAQRRGVTIRGDIVIGVFRNDFAVRMLEGNIDAGIEAPIRLHLTEEPDGTASIRYWLPSAVFGRYPSEAIAALGAELDPILAGIVADAAVSS